MMTFIVALIALLAGGAAGYLWGAKVERAAVSSAAAAKQAASSVATAASAGVSAVKKSL